MPNPRKKLQGPIALTVAPRKRRSTKKEWEDGEGKSDFPFNVTQPDGQVVRMPALRDRVEEMLLWGQRRQDILFILKEGPYFASSATIDRIIREVKDAWLAELQRTRQERVAKNRRRLERIVERAFETDDLSNARGAIMDQSKLTGDLAPDIHVLLGGDKDPEALLAQAEELKRLAQTTDPIEEA